MPDCTAKTAPSAAALAALADQCVACGLCLPHCPSYRVARLEAESPRGRISLMRGLALGQLQPDRNLQAHLDHCLGCLNCQAVCPAQVDYDQLISGTRVLLPPRRARSSRFLTWLTTADWRLRLSNLMLDRLLRWRVAGWPWPHGLRRRLAGLPAWTAGHSAGDPAAAVWLFAGCHSAALDRPAREAAAVLLGRLGLSVAAHPYSGCCGQLARMAGDSSAADRLAASLRKRLQRAGVRTLVSISSGCHGQLRKALEASGDADSPEIELTDLASLLQRMLRQTQLDCSPAREQVVYYEPCSQRAHLPRGRWQELLGRLPGLTRVELTQAPSCCGAAGSYFLDHPEQAEPLRNELIDGLLRSGVSRVLTSNGGCAQYLRAGLAARGSPIQVQHPVELLAERLPSAASPHEASTSVRR
jgi:glycolate oxidase iron-sulfur subunit